MSCRRTQLLNFRIILGLLCGLGGSLGVSTAGATPSLPTGFYKARGTASFLNQTFGDIVFLGVEDKLIRGPSGRRQIVTAWHLSYGRTGHIFLEPSPHSTALTYYYWDGLTHYGADTLHPIPFGKDRVDIGLRGPETLTLSAQSGSGLETETYDFLGSTLEALDDFGATRPDYVASRTEWLAHRGFGGIYPENSLEAFDQALRSGFGGFELDLRLTQDGAWVVSHDNRLDIATPCRGTIRTTPLHALKSCPLQFSGFIPESTIARTAAAVPAQIPTLAEVLRAFGRDSRLRTMVLDVKDIDGPVDSVNSLIGLLQEDHAPPARNLMIITTRAELALRFQEQLPEARVALESADGGFAPLSSTHYASAVHPEEFEGVENAPSVVSVNVGLGLAFDPDHSLTEIPLLLKALFELPFHHGKIDVDSFPWRCGQLRRMDRLVADAQASGKGLIAWEIYAPSKAAWIRSRFPSLEWVLTPAPSWEIGRAQMEYARSGFSDGCAQ